MIQHRGGGFDRRSFLRGSGAAAAALAASPGDAAAQSDDTQVFVGATTITLTVNGEDREAKVEPRTTLLEVLRRQFGLTGAKPVSSDGSSGASTVLVDDAPMAASTLLAIACRGKMIRTVESLGGETPDAVCQAFVEHDAQQCGFCTPGFVIAVRSFLDHHPNATEQEIRAGLNGNICRCGTYFDVITAAVSIVRGGGNG